jgi:hypothetical protein
LRKDLRKILCLLLILLIAVNTSDAKNIEKLKQNAIAYMNGVWVRSDYIAEIEKTKSPLKSFEYLWGIASMNINTTVVDDSIVVGASLNNHEGFEFTTYFISGLNSNSLRTNLSEVTPESYTTELGFETIQNQNYLFLYNYNKTNQIINKTKYSKIFGNDENNELGFGIQYIVNEKLFVGSYLMIDSLNNSRRIVFNRDGTVTGLYEFKSYYVKTDFVADAEPSIDEVFFNIRESTQKSFAYRIVGDTILLYTIKGDEDSDEPRQIDKLQFKLVRQ